jgi:hypothetical protein
MLSTMLERRLPFATLLTLAATLGCQPHPTDIPGPEQPWAEMSRDDRQIYMTTTVLPRMQETFATFDPEHFASVECSTCHVTGAARGDYAMPDPGLPNLAHFRREHMKKHPETVRFMWEQVEPEMEALLGGPKGVRGFNCRACHPVER